MAKGKVDEGETLSFKILGENRNSASVPLTFLAFQRYVSTSIVALEILVQNEVLDSK